jgi:hypothetical protein
MVQCRLARQHPHHNVGGTVRSRSRPRRPQPSKVPPQRGFQATQEDVVPAAGRADGLWAGHGNGLGEVRPGHLEPERWSRYLTLFLFLTLDSADATRACLIFCRGDAEGRWVWETSRDSGQGVSQRVKEASIGNLRSRTLGTQQHFEILIATQGRHSSP